MPIAINGTGTLTGISTGGISDTKAVADAAMPAGSVLQVVSTTKTDTFSGTVIHGGTDITGDITGLTVSITPSNTNNKILLMPSVCLSSQTGYPQIIFYKNNSVLTGAIGDAANKSYDNSALKRETFSSTGNNPYGATVTTGNFLDTAGGTSAITYSMRLTNAKHNGSFGANITMYVNRGYDQDEYVASYPEMARFISTFTAMEIAA